MAETPLLDAVRELLTNDEWPIEEMEELNAIRSRFRGDQGLWTFVVRAHEDDRQVLLYSIIENRAEEPYRFAVGEFITRANYGMRIGNFEMDFTDGEIRYKTSVDVEGGELTESMIRNLVGLNVSTVNRYFSGLQAVMEGFATPEDAIAKIES